MRRAGDPQRRARTLRRRQARARDSQVSAALCGEMMRRRSPGDDGRRRLWRSDAARVNMPERAARVYMSENGSPSDELDERWQKILEQQAKAKQERKTGQRRRASRHADGKQPSYKLPEIVIVRDSGGGMGRFG